MTDKYGPADIKCPYCLEEIHIKEGPTRRCEVAHCGKWILVDLVTGKAGHTDREVVN